MSSLLLNARSAVSLIAQGKARRVLRELRRRVDSTERFYCLTKDLSDPVDVPEARISVRLEEIDDASIDAVVRERPRLAPLLKAGIPAGYVGRTVQGDLCYVQWLIGPESNESMRQNLPNRVHRPLDPDQVMLEYAYTPKRYRGLGIMLFASATLAEIARTSGARWVLTVVNQNNLRAAHGFGRIGFELMEVRQIRWRLFRRQVTYEPPSAEEAAAFAEAAWSPPAVASPRTPEPDGECAGVDTHALIEEFVRTRFHVDPGDTHFDQAADVFEDGYIDSVGVIELLAYIEGEFGVEVPEEDLLSEEFSSIRGIATIVERQR